VWSACTTCSSHTLVLVVMLPSTATACCEDVSIFKHTCANSALPSWPQCTGCGQPASRFLCGQPIFSCIAALLHTTLAIPHPCTLHQMHPVQLSCTLCTYMLVFQQHVHKQLSQQCDRPCGVCHQHCSRLDDFGFMAEVVSAACSLCL
jgi:hypothetical protein